jgi:hypothetical protein
MIFCPLLEDKNSPQKLFRVKISCAPPAQIFFVMITAKALWQLIREASGDAAITLDDAVKPFTNAAASNEHMSLAADASNEHRADVNSLFACA